MNYTQSFEEFSASLGPTDLALYAGAGIVIWVLFKDRMSPVQKMLMDFFSSVKETVVDMTEKSPPSVVTVKVPMPELPKSAKPEEDNFFKLVASWKQTRDLAEKSKCEEAVKMLDDIFQYLSPNGCKEKSGE